MFLKRAKERTPAEDLQSIVFKRLTRFGSVTVSQLAVELARDVPEIEGALRSLQDRGLVELRNDPCACPSPGTPSEGLWGIVRSF